MSDFHRGTRRFADVESDSISTDKETIGGGPTASRTQALIHQETQTASGSAVTFTGLDADFTEYVLKFRNLVPGGDSEKLSGRVSTDGGSTFEAGGSDYQTELANVASGGSLAGAAVSGDHMEFTAGTVGNTTGEGLSGYLKVYDPSDASLFTHMEFQTIYHAAGDNTQNTRGGAEYLTAEAINAVKLEFGTGLSTPITSGELSLYGVLS